jgi:phospholipid-binding lipoprotein MlaA
MKPVLILSRPEDAQAETASEGNPTSVAQADSSPFSNPVKPSETEGPGDILRDPESAKDENYDPFAKPGETLEVEEYDPLEPFNRAVFTFNRKLDEYVLRPVAKVYEKVVPDGLEEGFSNAFRNIRFVPRFFNNVFQGKFKGAGIEASRFVVNSSLGLAGFLDFAKEVFHLETPPEDTGQTLGVYGVKPGPYLILPFLGSFTIRDGIGFVGDLALDPFNWLLFPIVVVDGWPQVVTNEDTILFAQLGIRAGYMVNERALNIDVTFEDLEKSTVDLYAAVRNAYLQKRAQLIHE